MTGMDNTIEQAARVMADALAEGADVDLFGGYTDTESLDDCVLDSRYSLIIVSRALAAAGLLAPAPLVEETETDQIVEWGGRPAVVERRRRWVTDWEPADRAEGDGSADT